MFEGFTRETSDFLWELTFHNERPWFQEHKEQYMRVLHEPFHALGEDALEIMRKDYPLSDFTLHVSRIYRDARRLFGRGPYKDHLWFTIFSGDNRHMEGPSFRFYLQLRNRFFRYHSGRHGSLSQQHRGKSRPVRAAGFSCDENAGL